MSAVASATEQSQHKIIPQPVREISADIAAGASDLVNEAKQVLSELTSPAGEKKTQPLDASSKPTRGAADKPTRSTGVKKGSTKTTARLKKPSSDT
jgi:hypothetical protein